MPERLLDEFDGIDVLIRDLSTRVDHLEALTGALSDELDILAGDLWTGYDELVKAVSKDVLDNLTQLRRVEDAVRALADTPGEPYEAARHARSILSRE